MSEEPPPRPGWLFSNMLFSNIRQTTITYLQLDDCRNYIEHLEAENRNLRESCDILKSLDAQKNAIIIELGGNVP